VRGSDCCGSTSLLHAACLCRLQEGGGPLRTQLTRRRATGGCPAAGVGGGVCSRLPGPGGVVVSGLLLALCAPYCFKPASSLLPLSNLRAHTPLGTPGVHRVRYLSSSGKSSNVPFLKESPGARRGRRARWRLAAMLITRAEQAEEAEEFTQSSHWRRHRLLHLVAVQTSVLDHPGGPARTRLSRETRRLWHTGLPFAAAARVCECAASALLKGAALFPAAAPRLQARLGCGATTQELLIGAPSRSGMPSAGYSAARAHPSRRALQLCTTCAVLYCRPFASSDRCARHAQPPALPRAAGEGGERRRVGARVWQRCALHAPQHSELPSCHARGCRCAAGPMPSHRAGTDRSCGLQCSQRNDGVSFRDRGMCRRHAGL